jgi:hypothetical protein
LDVWICRSWCGCSVLGRQHYCLLYVIKPGFASPLLSCFVKRIYQNCKMILWNLFGNTLYSFFESQTYHCFHVDSSWASRTSSTGRYSKGSGILFLFHISFISVSTSCSSNVVTVTDLVRYGTRLLSQRHIKTPLSVNFSM